MALIRVFIFDGSQFQTGLVDTSQPAGQQCNNPDPQTFNSYDQMVQYASANGENIQEVNPDELTSICSGIGQIGGAGGCCICQGGGSRNFVNGAGQVAVVPSVLPEAPQLSVTGPVSRARQIINQTMGLPINTVTY